VRPTTNLYEEANIGNGLWEIGLVTDDVTVTLKGQGHDPNILRAEYLENGVQMLFSNKFC